MRLVDVKCTIRACSSTGYQLPAAGKIEHNHTEGILTIQFNSLPSQAKRLYIYLCKVIVQANEGCVGLVPSNPNDSVSLCTDCTV